MTARIVEIFSSFQGEGLYAGQRQIFVRFAGCNLKCGYCDQPEAISSDSGAERRIDDIKRKILELRRDEHVRAVSLTGGEPLLQAESVREILPWLKEEGFQTHLETNATMPVVFMRVCSFVDVVSADIKLPSATGRNMWDAHKKFLAISPAKTFIKLVLTSGSLLKEAKKAVDITASISADIPFFIQPATELPGIKTAQTELVRGIFYYAAKKLSNIRVLPQQHPAWGVK